jgi:hypothetical protein
MEKAPLCPKDKSMLTAEQTAIVKATVPLLEAGARR